jgi:hypothetical protein
VASEGRVFVPIYGTPDRSFVRLRDHRPLVAACVLQFHGLMLRLIAIGSNITFLALYLVAGLWTGCSEVSFQEAPKAACNGFNQACVLEVVGDKKYNVFEYTETVPQPLVDILFVDDNSKSMIIEQEKMGERFPNFLASIGGLDWRIAVTTTDIFAQGGNLLEFSPGLRILTPSMSGSDALFKSTIRRSEIGSGDERGIYAANLVIDRKSQNQFFRDSAHFAVVILSDEDERSYGGTLSSGTQTIDPLESYDFPETFKSNVTNKLGSSKTTSVHSIVIKPGDSACKQMQDNQTHIGQYGTIYALLSQMTQGILGDICASDYGAQLATIGNQIVKHISSMKLACEPATGAGLEPVIIIKPQTSPATQGTINGDQIFFDHPLPAGTEISLKYRCQI